MESSNTHAPEDVSHGLTEAEAVLRRRASGSPRDIVSTRSYATIVRANVFTFFNVVLLAFGALTLIFGDWQDVLFVMVVVSNASIGILQEARAKRALDRLSAMVSPVARVVRSGTVRDIHVDQVVVGDLVRVQAGDKIVADGELVEAGALRIDESILTGESRAVEHARGAEVRSGSFVVEGHGAYVVHATGADSYAARITGEARAFRHPRSPLERALNRLLFVLIVVLLPLGLMLGYALWSRHTPMHDAVPRVVAAVVTLVPEGLILLASMTFAVAALRMARHGALAQQLNAIESLASVDVMCIDKTGTLTEPQIRVVRIIGGSEVESMLACYGASVPAPNKTLAAIAAFVPGQAAQVEEEIPFSSLTKFSAARIAGVGYVLGAPEHFDLGEFSAEANALANSGRRVLAFGTASDLDAPHPTTIGLVILAEQLRPNIGETVEFLGRQGVTLKVLSGDSPETVSAIAADAGIAGASYDASTLPDDPSELREVIASHDVFGRISPDGKRSIVESLRDDGRYVAMVGDGVNDVPAMKASRLAIAQGSGAQMARSVADLVLVHGNFGAVPLMVDEGRKILRNVQRVTKLFVTKSMFAVFMILTVGITQTPYPLLPRQLTLAATLTVGIPAFFFALAPSVGAYNPQRFLRQLARFAVPAGTAAGLGVVSSYLCALNVLNVSVGAARTVATTVLVIVGLYLVYVLEARGWKRGTAVFFLCLALIAAFVVVVVWPFSRHFFALQLPTLAMLVTEAFGCAITIFGLTLVDDQFIPEPFRISR